MTLTGRTALLAAVGMVGVFVIPHGWVLAAVDGGLLLAVLTDRALAVAPGALALHRGGAGSARLGETVAVHLTVTNPAGRTLRALVRDAWPPSATAAPRSTRLAVPAAERRTVTTLLAPTRRGDQRAAFVAVRSLGPLGLAGRQGRLSAPWTVRVLPGFPSRRHLPGKLAALRELTGGHATQLRGHGTQFDSMRDYVAGDDVRSIDWRATARRSDVAVRTWRPERDRRVVLVLDTGRTSAARVGDVPRLDAALDAALLMAALASRAGDSVDLLAFDSRLRAAVTRAGRTGVLAAIVHATATLQPALVEADMHAIVAEVLRRAPRRCLVVLLTALDPAPVEQGLLPVLGALTARHEVVLAAVADPAVAALAGGRGNASAVYAAAAAERTLADRARMADTLRQRGVAVVEAPPATLASALADSYIARKAAGRL